MKDFFRYFAIVINIVMISLIIRYYIYHKDDPVIFFKSSKAAVFVYKNGIETDSYTSEVKVSQEHAAFLRVEENGTVKVFFKLEKE